jgi:hypothetical protein
MDNPQLHEFLKYLGSNNPNNNTLDLFRRWRPEIAVDQLEKTIELSLTLYHCEHLPVTCSFVLPSFLRCPEVPVGQGAAPLG